VWQLDRDRIWFFAWACVPLAIALNTLFAADLERSARLSQQAQVDFDSGDWRRAARRFAAAAEDDPSSAVFAFNAGAAYLRAGAVRKAAHWNAEALRRDPALPEAQRARGAIEQALRRGRPRHQGYPPLEP